MQLQKEAREKEETLQRMLSAEKRVRALEEDNRQLRREHSEMKKELDKMRKEVCYAELLFPRVPASLWFASTCHWLLA